MVLPHVYLAAEEFDVTDSDSCNGCIGAGTASAISLFTWDMSSLSCAICEAFSIPVAGTLIFED